MRWDILPADGERWRQALTSLRHDVYHLPEYVAIEARRHGADPVGVVAVDGRRRWAVPLLLRPVPGTGRVDASSPYGYPGPLSNAALTDSSFFEDALLALRDSLTSMGAISCFLRLHPFLGPPLESFKRAGSLVVHGQTVVIDLSRSEEELWTGLRANHRIQIRRARGRRGHRRRRRALESAGRVRERLLGDHAAGGRRGAVLPAAELLRGTAPTPGTQHPPAVGREGRRGDRRRHLHARPAASCSTTSAPPPASICT